MKVWETVHLFEIKEKKKIGKLVTVETRTSDRLVIISQSRTKT